MEWRNNFDCLIISLNIYSISPTTHLQWFYTCESFNLRVMKSGVKVASVFGQHNVAKTNKDVVVFSNQFTKTSHLPQGIGLVFPRLSRFFVVASKLRFIERRNFVGLTRLKILDLRFNEIEAIPDDAFLDLFSLEVITLSGNLLTTLPTNCFVTMLSLRYFDASDNLIETFNDEIFSQNENLQEILLEHNKISRITANFTQFRDVGFIDLRNNVCTEDNFYLRGFPNLPTLAEFQESINERCEDARNEIVKRSTTTDEQQQEIRVLQWDVCPRTMPSHMMNVLCLLERKFKLNWCSRCESGFTRISSSLFQYLFFIHHHLHYLCNKCSRLSLLPCCIIIHSVTLSHFHFIYIKRWAMRCLTKQSKRTKSPTDLTFFLPVSGEKISRKRSGEDFGRSYHSSINNFSFFQAIYHLDVWHVHKSLIRNFLKTWNSQNNFGFANSKFLVL